LVNLRIAEPDRSKRLAHSITLLTVTERLCVVGVVDLLGVPRA
jgi:hypothetical protein